MKNRSFGAIGVIVAIVAGAAIIVKVLENQLKGSSKQAKKFEDYYNILVPWLELKQQGDGLADYFLKHGYKTIAIYGMGNLGNCLYEELKESEIEMKYAVDKNLSYAWSEELEIIEFGNTLPTADVIVVTPVFAFDGIKKELQKYFAGDIVSLKDVIISV